MTEPRSIETKGYAKLAVPATFGRIPKLEWLSISSLVVDPEYQREISSLGRKNIRHIAEHFNWPMFGTVMVAAIGGSRFAIVDGQHRTTAAALCGIEKVPCQIVEALRGEQAAAFRAINGNTTRPHTIQLFHASVAAGEPAALRIVDVCRKVGIRIPRSLSPLKDYETYCVGAIGKGIQRHGEAVVELALRLIVHSGAGAAAELNRTIIVAVTEVLARFPDWQTKEARLKQIFEDFNLEDLWRDATAQAVRVKGSSGLEILQRELTKKILQKMQGAA
jgi:hypothetical protein